MNPRIVKRSIVIDGHKTSVSIEDAFWKALKGIASRRHVTLAALVAAIDRERHDGNLSSAIRLFVLDYYVAGHDATLENKTLPQVSPSRH